MVDGRDHAVRDDEPSTGSDEDNTFPNVAGVEDPDERLSDELTAAGISVVDLYARWSGEVRAKVVGRLGPWHFNRAWYYWRASGPGIPPEDAAALHEAHGTAVRVDGHCGCPTPKEWFGGFGVGDYHVDTPAGLAALARTISEIMRRAPDVWVRRGLMAEVTEQGGA